MKDMPKMCVVAFKQRVIHVYWLVTNTSSARFLDRWCLTARFYTLMHASSWLEAYVRYPVLCSKKPAAEPQNRRSFLSLPVPHAHRHGCGTKHLAVVLCRGANIVFRCAYRIFVEADPEICAPCVSKVGGRMLLPIRRAHLEPLCRIFSMCCRLFLKVISW